METINWAALAREEGFLNDDGSVITEGYRKPFDDDVVYVKPQKGDSDRTTISFTDDRSTMYFGNAEGVVEYRRLTERRLGGFYISDNGILRNANGDRIRKVDRSMGGQPQYRLTIAPKVRRYYFVDELVGQVWPERHRRWNGDVVHIGGNEHRLIPSFPNYVISVFGDVVRLESMRKVTVKNDRVQLYAYGKNNTRSLSKLYRETFGRDLGE